MVQMICRQGQPVAVTGEATLSAGVASRDRARQACAYTRSRSPPVNDPARIEDGDAELYALAVTSSHTAARTRSPKRRR